MHACFSNRTFISLKREKGFTGGEKRLWDPNDLVNCWNMDVDHNKGFFATSGALLGYDSLEFEIGMNPYLWFFSPCPSSFFFFKGWCIFHGPFPFPARFFHAWVAFSYFKRLISRLCWFSLVLVFFYFFCCFSISFSLGRRISLYMKKHLGRLSSWNRMQSLYAYTVLILLFTEQTHSWFGRCNGGDRSCLI